MASNTHPLISVVVLNWNGLSDTKVCLDYVRQLNYPNYEIIVVDNGSSPEEKQYLSKLKDITYIDNPKNRGFAGGQSDGYKQARGDFILLLNNDAVIHPEYLHRAMPLFDDPEVAVVGGRSYFWNDKESLLDTSNRFYAYMDVNPITAETTLRMEDEGLIQEVNVVSGSAVIVRKTATLETGYLWEPFFAYYEETDLFARIKRAGYKVLYHPGLYIWHKNGASSGAQSGSSFFYYHIFRNRYMFAVRNFDDKYLSLFKKSYYRLLRTSLAEAPRSRGHRTLAKAYLRAANEIKKNEPKLLKDRKDLQEKLDNSTYSQLIIAEQNPISIVIDGTKLSDHDLKNINKSLHLPKYTRHEYVIVVNKDSKLKSEDYPSHIRKVTSRGYFDTHPINLGCIVAKNDWLVIADISKVENISHYSDILTTNYTRDFKVVDLGKSSVMLKKSFFELIGGLSKDPKSLNKNIDHILKYSLVDNSLLSDRHIEIPDEDKRTLSSQIHTDYELLAINKNTLWQRLLSRYYRLQQLRNLTVWSFHPKISPRLKAGRTKNLVLSVVTLNKKRLATELKHIKNEAFKQSKLYKASQLSKSLKKDASLYANNQIKNPSNIPVFIITFERVDDLKKLVQKLEKIGLRRIVFIDNGSTYPPLRDYLKKTTYQTLELGRNIGHTAPWTLAITRSLIPLGYYIVTDPDILPTDECLSSSVVTKMLEVHKKYPDHHKVGLSLKIDDLPDHYPLKQDVINWERQFWESELEEGVYEAPIDTTFAMYKPTLYSYLLGPSIRLSEPYSARHMPWYSNPSKLSDEDIFYKNRANADVTSWNVDELPERYKKEMNRDK